jgi:hypothetical protein
VIVGVRVIVGVLLGGSGVTVARLIESLTEHPLVKLSVTLNEPRSPPAGTPVKSVAQVRVELPGWLMLAEPLVGEV